MDLYKPKFNVVQVCSMVGAIVFFIIMNTQAFTEFSDWLKVAIYAGFVVAVAVAGVSPGSIKDLLEKAKRIFDKDVPAEEKISELMSIFTTVAAQLGYYWEKLNEQQGIITRIKDTAVKLPELLKKNATTNAEIEDAYYTTTDQTL